LAKKRPTPAAKLTDQTPSTKKADITAIQILTFTKKHLPLQAFF
jgi:hypothetical protein